MDNPFRPGQSPLVRVGNAATIDHLSSHLQRLAAGQVSGFARSTQLVSGPTGWGVTSCLDWAATEAERHDLEVLRLKFTATQENWAMLMSRVMGVALAHYPKKPSRDIKKPMKAATKFFEHFGITDPATHAFPLTASRLRDQTASWSAHVASLRPLLALATFCVTETDRAGLLIIIDDIHHATRMEVENLSTTRSRICTEDGPLGVILGGNQHIINHRRNHPDTDKDPDDSMPRPDFAEDRRYTEHQLHRLSDEEVTTLITTTTPHNPWDPQALTELIRITNGIPWAIQDLGHHLWTNNPPTPGHTITPTDLKAAASTYCKKLHNDKYPQIWAELSTKAKKLFYLLTQLTDNRQCWSVDGLEGMANQGLISAEEFRELSTQASPELRRRGMRDDFSLHQSLIILPFFMDYVRAVTATPQSQS